MIFSRIASIHSGVYAQRLKVRVSPRIFSICATTSSYHSVERRCEYGGQKQVDAVLDRYSCEVFYDSPVLLAPYGNAVVVSQTVAVEPLCEQKLLLGQYCVNCLDFKALGSLDVSVFTVYFNINFDFLKFL